MSFLTNLKVSGIPVVDYDGTSDFTTDAFLTNDNWDIGFHISDGLSSGSPATYTIQCSNDNIEYYNYSSAVNISVDDAVKDNHFPFKYIRVVYTANGATEDVTFNLFIKAD